MADPEQRWLVAKRLEETEPVPDEATIDGALWTLSEGADGRSYLLPDDLLNEWEELDGDSILMETGGPMTADQSEWVGRIGPDLYIAYGIGDLANFKTPVGRFADETAGISAAVAQCPHLYRGTDGEVCTDWSGGKGA